jgi:hypothetical protein
MHVPCRESLVSGEVVRGIAEKTAERAEISVDSAIINALSIS